MERMIEYSGLGKPGWFKIVAGEKDMTGHFWVTVTHGVEGEEEETLELGRGVAAALGGALVDVVLDKCLNNG